MDAPPAWNLHAERGVRCYVLDTLSELLVAFATRHTGTSEGPFASLNLSPETGDAPDAVERNRELLKIALRIPALVTLRQTHSDIVLPVFYSKTPADLLEGDAAFTDVPGLALGIKVADCLPVYVYSRNPPAVGIAHCGWRGTVARIAEKLARMMSRRFAVPLTDLCFALGPCICPDCYTVGEDVLERFAQTFPAHDRFFRPAPRNHSGSNSPSTPGTLEPLNPSSRPLNPSFRPLEPLTPLSNSPSTPGTLEPLNPLSNSPSTPGTLEPLNPSFHLALRAANRWLLLQLGLTETGSLDLCTRENDAQLYSARRETPTGRNLALISLR